MFFVNYKFLACGHVFRDGLRNAAVEMGVESDDADWEDPSLAAKVEAFDPDLVFVVHGRKFARRWGQAFAGRPTAVWLLDEPYEVDDTAKFSRLFDHVFVNDPATLGRHDHAHYLPACYDPHVHRCRPGSLRRYRVGFIGGSNPRRESLLNAIAERGLLDYVVGGPWRSSRLAALSLGSNVSPERAAELYAETRIVVNIFRSIHHFNREAIPAKSMNPRIYEALASGALVVSESRNEIRAKLPPLPTFRNDEEPSSLIEYHLSHPVECAELQAACFDRVRTDTYADRLRTVLEVTKGSAERRAPRSLPPAHRGLRTSPEYGSRERGSHQRAQQHLGRGHANSLGRDMVLPSRRRDLPRLAGARAHLEIAQPTIDLRVAPLAVFPT